MHVAILHDRITDDSAPDVRDVFTQIEAVEAALQELGHTSDRLQLRPEAGSLHEDLDRLRPQVVFNLAESVMGDEAAAPLAAFALELAEIPFTGNGSRASMATYSKPECKVKLRRAALPTPSWLDPFGAFTTPPTARPRLPARMILKPAKLHASQGIDDSCIIEAKDPPSVKALLRQRMPDSNMRWFAEQYIDGREFNVSLLADDSESGMEALPPAEIVFESYAPDKPRIVGYDAKWTEGSFEYTHTPRRFEFPESDSPLLAELRDLAAQCAAELELRGYARIDFRVDSAGRPWILEVNTNPCLSPDAGFAAAVSAAGLRFQDAIARILEDAVRAGHTL